jgi:hypothetical protein
MRRIRISNPLVDKTFKTFISTDYIPVSSTTSLQVLNTTAFKALDILVIGEPGEELAEKGNISAVVDIDTLTLVAALNFSHPKSTSVYKTSWDKISIESATPGGTFSEIVSTNIQWDNQNNETVYYDTSGTDTTLYRFRFYNSVTASYAEYSPTITGAGFSKAQVGFMISEVRGVVNDEERKIVSDDEIIRAFNTAQDIIYARNPRYWFLLVDTYKGANGIPCVASTDVYDLDVYANFGHLDRVRFLYNNGQIKQIYDLQNQSGLEFDVQVSDLSQTGNDYADTYKLIPPDSTSTEGYLQIYPKPINAYGTLYPIYYKQMDTLNTVDDSTPVPLPQLLENFAIAHVERIKGNDTKAKLYEDMFYGIPDKYKQGAIIGGLALLDNLDNANKRPQGQPRSLWSYKGDKLTKRYMNRDYVKENYF